jgi:4-hydroxy-2-oxoheptanedioate aldolase
MRKICTSLALVIMCGTTQASAQSSGSTRQILDQMLPSPVRPIIPTVNPIHLAIKSNKALFMPFLSTGSLRIAEACTLPTQDHLGAAGIWIETEHSPLTLREIEDLTIFCHAQGLVPVVRVKKNDVDLFKQILDLGALGVVIPQIHTAGDATLAVKSCLYPPEGNRPAGVGRASGYFSQFTQYKKVANDLMCVALMVETKDAVRNIDAICQVMRPGKDVLWIGPFDLSLDMGVAVGSKEHSEAIEAVERAAARHGIALGGNAATLQQAEAMYSRGYRLFTYGDPPETTLAKSADRFFAKEASP